jgi:hypothetical protein
MASFDMVPLMLQMMAAELISLREKVETQADAGVFTAPSSNGLMGLSTLVHPDDEDPVAGKVREIAQKTGAIIRERAGLNRSVKSAPVKTLTHPPAGGDGRPSGGGGALATTIYASSRHELVVIPALAWGGGIGAAVLIGSVAGLWPAIRAAHLSPTQALWSM